MVSIRNSDVEVMAFQNVFGMKLLINTRVCIFCMCPVGTVSLAKPVAKVDTLRNGLV